MQKARWALGMLWLSTLGCSQTNGRDGVDAAVDTREVPRDGAMEVTRESLCVGLDPASQACAREVLARIDRDACLDSLSCASTPVDPSVCDVYSPEQGSWMVEGYRRQLVLVRLGRLRIDLDAAVCTLRDRALCGNGLDLRCGPVFVPTAAFASCTEDEECGRDGYCTEFEPSGCELGVCRPRLAPGAACGVGSPCAWAELCLGGFCRPVAGPPRRSSPLGAPCGQIVDGVGYYNELCTEGLACAFGADFPATCIRISGPFEPCGGCPGPDCATCGSSLRCDEGVCMPYSLPREGDPCNGPLGMQGLCDWTTYGLVCEAGFCATSEARIGDVCRIPCIEGYCAPTEDGPSRCMATRLPNGAPCSAIDQCENGLCCDGVCVPLAE